MGGGGRCCQPAVVGILPPASPQHPCLGAPAKPSAREDRTSAPLPARPPPPPRSCTHHTWGMAVCQARAYNGQEAREEQQPREGVHGAGGSAATLDKACFSAHRRGYLESLRTLVGCQSRGRDTREKEEWEGPGRPALLPRDALTAPEAAPDLCPAPPSIMQRVAGCRRARMCGGRSKPWSLHVPSSGLRRVWEGAR